MNYYHIVSPSDANAEQNLTPVLKRIDDEISNLHAGGRMFLVAIIPLPSRLEQTDELMQMELTSEEAAKSLDLAHAFFNRVLDMGEMPFRQDGAQRRVCLEDLTKYIRSEHYARVQAGKELTRLSQEMGLY